MRKYAILDILRQMPYWQYKQLRQSIPEHLNVSRHTFKRWIYLKKTDKAEIPLNKLKKIAQLLNVDINQLV